MNSLIERIKVLSHPLLPIPTNTELSIQPLEGIETILFDIYGTLLISGSGDVGTKSATNSSEAFIQASIDSGYVGDHQRAGQLGPDLFRSEIERWHTLAKEKEIDFPEVKILQVWKEVINQIDILTPKNDQQKNLRLAIEYEMRVNPIWPMPNALKTIENLRARGFRLGIISNAQFYTPLSIEALLGKSLKNLGFEEKLCIFSYKELRAKPSVELFQKLENRIDWSKTLYVGNDMLNDIWTASQVGCRTCLFAGDKRSLRKREKDKRCKGLTPDAIIDNLHQITEIL